MGEIPEQSGMEDEMDIIIGKVETPTDIKSHDMVSSSEEVTELDNETDQRKVSKENQMPSEEDTKAGVNSAVKDVNDSKNKSEDDFQSDMDKKNPLADAEGLGYNSNPHNEDSDSVISNSGMQTEVLEIFGSINPKNEPISQIGTDTFGQEDPPTNLEVVKNGYPTTPESNAPLLDTNISINPGDKTDQIIGMESITTEVSGETQSSSESPTHVIDTGQQLDHVEISGDQSSVEVGQGKNILKNTGLTSIEHTILSTLVSGSSIPDEEGSNAASVLSSSMSNNPIQDDTFPRTSGLWEQLSTTQGSGFENTDTAQSLPSDGETSHYGRFSTATMQAKLLTMVEATTAGFDALNTNKTYYDQNHDPTEEVGVDTKTTEAVQQSSEADLQGSKVGSAETDAKPDEEESHKNATLRSDDLQATPVMAETVAQVSVATDIATNLSAENTDSPFVVTVPASNEADPTANVFDEYAPDIDWALNFNSNSNLREFISSSSETSTIPVSTLSEVTDKTVYNNSNSENSINVAEEDQEVDKSKHLDIKNLTGHNVPNSVQNGAHWSSENGPVAMKTEHDMELSSASFTLSVPELMSNDSSFYIPTEMPIDDFGMESTTQKGWVKEDNSITETYAIDKQSSQYEDELGKSI